MAQYASNSNEREDQVIRYLPLVKFIAGRIRIGKQAPIDIDDLVSYGIIGLIDAIDKFDPSKGVKFETYASLRIKGSIIDEIRKLSWMPRTAMGKITKLNETKDNLRNKLGREPDSKEIAEDMGLSQVDLRKTESYINYLSMVSLEDVIFHSGEDELVLSSTIEDIKSPRPDNIVEEKEEQHVLKEAIDLLDEKDRLILSLYYYEKLTLKEIGQVMDISESRVSQLHSRVIIRLRENFKKLGYLNMPIK